MKGVSAEVSVEVVLSFEQRDRDSLANEQAREQHSSGARADNTHLRFSGGR